MSNPDRSVAIPSRRALLLAALTAWVGVGACADASQQSHLRPDASSFRGAEPSIQTAEPSMQAVQAQFDAFVQTANACETASECAIVRPGCPLGCFVAVRQDRMEDVEAKARQLIAEFSLGGTRICLYLCQPEGAVSCTQNRCVAAILGPVDAATGSD